MLPWHPIWLELIVIVLEEEGARKTDGRLVVGGTMIVVTVKGDYVVIAVATSSRTPPPLAPPPVVGGTQGRGSTTPSATDEGTEAPPRTAEADKLLMKMAVLPVMSAMTPMIVAVVSVMMGASRCMTTGAVTRVAGMARDGSLAAGAGMAVGRARMALTTAEMV